MPPSPAVCMAPLWRRSDQGGPPSRAVALAVAGRTTSHAQPFDTSPSTHSVDWLTTSPLTAAAAAGLIVSQKSAAPAIYCPLKLIRRANFGCVIGGRKMISTIDYQVALIGLQRLFKMLKPKTNWTNHIKSAVWTRGDKMPHSVSAAALCHGHPRCGCCKRWFVCLSVCQFVLCLSHNPNNGVAWKRDWLFGSHFNRSSLIRYSATTNGRLFSRFHARRFNSLLFFVVTLSL